MNNLPCNKPPLLVLFLMHLMACGWWWGTINQHYHFETCWECFHAGPQGLLSQKLGCQGQQVILITGLRVSALIGPQRCSVVSSKHCSCGDSSIRVCKAGYVKVIQNGDTLSSLPCMDQPCFEMTEMVSDNRNYWSFVGFSSVNM